MKVAFMGYRDWANKIFDRLRPLQGVLQVSELHDADIVLFYGWSAMIPVDVYSSKICLILHPSPLPKYRGGSPLQHQIMNGEKESAVTICRVTDKLDAGDIYSQTSFSLAGSLEDIFNRIIEIGIADTVKVIKQIGDNVEPKPQDESRATTLKRRTPEESEIVNILDWGAEPLYNFIRALNDPYPNAFIRCEDGKKLYITGAHL